MSHSCEFFPIPGKIFSGFPPERRILLFGTKKHLRFGKLSAPDKSQVFIGLKKKVYRFFRASKTDEQAIQSPFELVRRGRKALRGGRFQYIAPCFCLSERWSAIMAMNSLLVGFPLMLLTV